MTHDAPESSAPRTGWGRALLTSPWVWGGLLTIAFYQAIPHLPVGREMAVRYFCSHPIEYAEVTLFLIGLTIIVFKTCGLVREKRVFATVAGFDSPANEPAGPFDDRLADLSDRLQRVPRTDRKTYWFRRLDHLRGFLKNRRDGLDEHLKFLSESAQGELAESHSSLQMIIWAIPILGFLGTVMGITLAIANITPDQLDSSLGSVTGGLSVAFDTTALGLAQSLVLGFASLFVRRTEERLLGQIDERSRIELHRVLPSEESSSVWVAAQSSAARQLIERTEALIGAQAAVWQQSLDEFRQRWMETLEHQRDALARSLTAGTEATLVDHGDQLLDFRKEFVAAYSEVSQQLTAEVARLAALQHDSPAALAAVLDQFAEQFDRRLQGMFSRREQVETERVDALVAGISAWQLQMRQLNDTTQEMVRAVQAQSQTLLRIVGQEEQLAGLQQRLTENLEAVRAAESFEDAVHQLTGAIHLLTARTRPREAA